MVATHAAAPANSTRTLAVETVLSEHAAAIAELRQYFQTVHVFKGVYQSAFPLSYNLKLTKRYVRRPTFRRASGY